MKWQGWSFTLASLLVVASVALVTAGCNSGGNDGGGDAHGDHGDGGHDHHDHAATGEHGGDLLELGGGKYHAELVHGEDTHVITVYLLDEKLKSPVAAAEDAVRINLMVMGNASQHDFKAVEATDGKASQFTLESEALAKALVSDMEEIVVRLTVDIDEKSYNTKIEAHDHHGHDHGDHGHGDGVHGDHDEDDHAHEEGHDDHDGHDHDDHDHEDDHDHKDE